MDGEAGKLRTGPKRQHPRAQAIAPDGSTVCINRAAESLLLGSDDLRANETNIWVAMGKDERGIFVEPVKTMPGTTAIVKLCSYARGGPSRFGATTLGLPVGSVYRFEWDQERERAYLIPEEGKARGLEAESGLVVKKAFGRRKSQ